MFNAVAVKMSGWPERHPAGGRFSTEAQ